jgi:low temperature requirement protein LtrA
MTPTQGFIVSGMALGLGCLALIVAQSQAKSSVRVVSIILGAVLGVGSVIWLLLSIAAYGGNS